MYALAWTSVSVCAPRSSIMTSIFFLYECYSFLKIRAALSKSYIKCSLSRNLSVSGCTVLYRLYFGLQNVIIIAPCKPDGIYCE